MSYREYLEHLETKLKQDLIIIGDTSHQLNLKLNLIDLGWSLREIVMGKDLKKEEKSSQEMSWSMKRNHSENSKNIDKRGVSLEISQRNFTPTKSPSNLSKVEVENPENLVDPITYRLDTIKSRYKELKVKEQQGLETLTSGELQELVDLEKLVEALKFYISNKKGRGQPSTHTLPKSKVMDNLKTVDNLKVVDNFGVFENSKDFDNNNLFENKKEGAKFNNIDFLKEATLPTFERSSNSRLGIEKENGRKENKPYGIPLEHGQDGKVNLFEKVSESSNPFNQDQDPYELELKEKLIGKFEDSTPSTSQSLLQRLREGKDGLISVLSQDSVIQHIPQEEIAPKTTQLWVHENENEKMHPYLMEYGEVVNYPKQQKGKVGDKKLDDFDIKVMDFLKGLGTRK